MFMPSTLKTLLINITTSTLWDARQHDLINNKATLLIVSS